jgi:ATP-dependent Clp protease ATP-binding subunit ClpA
VRRLPERKSPTGLGCFGHWVKEADALGRDTTSTHHLVLGLLRVTDGGAVRLLLELGVRPEQVREQVLAQLSTAPEEWPTSMQQEQLSNVVDDMA